MDLAEIFAVAAAGGFIGGLVSAVIARRRHRRRERELRDVLLAEYSYWHNTDVTGDVDQQAIAIGAMGAVSNVLGALAGHPAPWHPGQKGGQEQ